jgi:hypothetical protein
MNQQASIRHLKIAIALVFSVLGWELWDICLSSIFQSLMLSLQRLI